MSVLVSLGNRIRIVKAILGHEDVFTCSLCNFVGRRRDYVPHLAYDHNIEKMRDAIRQDAEDGY